MWNITVKLQNSKNKEKFSKASTEVKNKTMATIKKKVVTTREWEL